MFFNNRQMTGHPCVDRMIEKRDREQAELLALQEELRTLQEVVRSRQGRLRKMNQRIILRSSSQHYLKVASSQPPWRLLRSGKDDYSNEEANNRQFSCINGGKP